MQLRWTSYFYTPLTSQLYESKIEDIREEEGERNGKVSRGIDFLFLGRVEVGGDNFSQFASKEIGNMGLTHACQARIAFCTSVLSS